MSEFYHASKSGENNSIIHSFRNGINSQLATGHGQGNGFYVFINKQDAIEHSMAKGNYKTVELSGCPIVVTIDIQENPELFDVDYEVLYNTIIFSFGTKRLSQLRQLKTIKTKKRNYV